jgi:hypothetical protein
MIVVQTHFKKKNDKNPCLSLLQRFFSLHKSDTTQTLFICCVSLARSPDSNRRRTPVYTYLHFKIACSVSPRQRHSKSLRSSKLFPPTPSYPEISDKNELYVDNFTVNIQHSRPVEENAEVEGDTW